MRYQRIAIVGGTGFVGKYIVSELARRHYSIRLLTRRRERQRSLIVIPGLELVETNLHSSSHLSDTLRGCDAVINLAGILNNGWTEHDRFQSVHVELPLKLGEAMRFNKIDRYLHMGALNASADAPSEYLRSKHQGEQAAHGLSRHGVAVTSFNPSVLFGEGDSFLNRFADLVGLAPLVVPLACPDARFAPAFVGDVARAFVDTLEDKASFGERYDLCGPKQYSLREIVEYVCELTGHRRFILPLGPWLSRVQAQVMQNLPGAPFSVDNYLSLQIDSICHAGNGFERLDITPRSLESVAPRYIGHRSRADRLNALRRRARG